ncbi:MAG TPA: DoxX family protein [Candidatus Acidoferrum sp.]
MFNSLRVLYAKVVRIVSSLQSSLLLFIRVYWGWQLAQSGWGKLHNLPKVTDFFTSLNLPHPAQMAVFISCVELFGGIFLAIGLLSRLTGLVLTINMLMAYITADRVALASIFSAPDKFQAADPFIFLFVALIVLIIGPGQYSVDTLLLRVLGPPRDKNAVTVKT